MKKQLSVASSQLPVPKPHAMQCPACGHEAVDVPFFSPRAAMIVEVVICSVCNPSFYPKAEQLVRQVAA